ncbi:TPA: hypothetical protein N0F65_002191 [Lagenidium giganteum]|uniref:Fe2OG dioxygenase domain-containing protein n=1 Tax=Lagenidium giganteum TaxID=4803 RepID=A0AAV2YMJ6_9STRA|nr:TPA: hypothetical protein N0F65_002191 [Lagenidium giganteum]
MLRLLRPTASPAVLQTHARSLSHAAMNAQEVGIDSVPLVDIAPLMAATRGRAIDPAQKRDILAQLKDASLNTGFLTIPTAGVLPNGLIRAVYRRKDEFLALPQDIKQKYHVKKVPNARGWTPLYEEPSYQPGVISRLEGFDLAYELPASYLNQGSLGPNVWPHEISGFRQDVYQLYEETTHLSHLMFQSFAEMLDLPANTFAQHVSETSEAFMRLLTYPETDSPVKNSTVGIASHTDFECFTIIHQNGEGLHLLNRQGQWVQAPACEDRLFIMIGDCLERWTNGLLKATEHRVVNSEKKRQSIVRFNGVDGDTVIQPLPQFVSATNPARYAKTTQRQHIEEQINQAEEHLQEAKAAQSA